jgi:hypothetical protein
LISTLHICRDIIEKMATIIKKRVYLSGALIVAALFSIIASVSAFIVQTKGVNKVSQQCSYLDPISIDVLAFSAAIFLVVDGFYNMAKRRKSETLGDAMLISIRIAFGFAIITLHTIQFIHK